MKSTIWELSTIQICVLQLASLMSAAFWCLIILIRSMFSSPEPNIQHKACIDSPNRTNLSGEFQNSFTQNSTRVENHVNMFTFIFQWSVRQNFNKFYLHLKISRLYFDLIWLPLPDQFHIRCLVFSSSF